MSAFKLEKKLAPNISITVQWKEPTGTMQSQAREDKRPTRPRLLQARNGMIIIKRSARLSRADSVG